MRTRGGAPSALARVVLAPSAGAGTGLADVDGDAPTDGTTPDLAAMTQDARSFSFEHDGHRFDGTEQVGRTPDGAEPSVHWVVHMDGAPALEFRGPHPYRDDDVRARVLQWYEIQRPRVAPGEGRASEG